LNRGSKKSFYFTKVFFSWLEAASKVVILILPLHLLQRLIKFFRPSWLAKLISSFDSVKVYEISILGADLIVESGPRDDHYLDLEKNEMANWEHASLGVWLELCKHADFAIDVGAYLGVYSILAARVGCKKVIAIEPNPRTYKQLERNVALNFLVPEICTLQIAVGEVEESVSLKFPYGRPLSSGTQISKMLETENLSEWETQGNVQMVRLDSLIVASKKEEVVLKIDVEGFELEVLKGATDLLINNFPQIIVEILSDERKVEVDSYLQKFGYTKGIPIMDSSKASNMLYK